MLVLEGGQFVRAAWSDRCYDLGLCCVADERQGKGTRIRAAR
jgi:hypothetical protein